MVQSDILARLLLESFDGVVYLCDMETYDLVYMNAKMAKLVGIPEDAPINAKCYEVLYKISKPCEHCTNQQLLSGESQYWVKKSEYTDDYYQMQDKMIEVAGRKLRLDYGTNITELIKAKQLAESKTLKVELFMHATAILYETDNIDDAITQILKELAGYFMADRAYIFEHNKKSKSLVSSYFYASPTAKPFKDILANSSEEELQIFLSAFIEKDRVYHVPVIGSPDEKTPLYQDFIERDVRFMLIMPIYQKNDFVGLIGIDNPRLNLDHSEIVMSLGSLIMSELHKRQLVDHLNYLSNVDKLTGIYNTNKFSAVLNEIKEQSEDVGIIYIDLNGLKKINDTYGHEKGDIYLKDVTRYLQTFFGRNIYRIGGDEFVVILRNLSKNAFRKACDEFAKDQETHNQFSMSFGEEFCVKGKVEEAINKADLCMITRKRLYYENLNKKKLEENQEQTA